jgi:hypothetical protein
MSEVQSAIVWLVYRTGQSRNEAQKSTHGDFTGLPSVDSLAPFSRSTSASVCVDEARVMIEDIGCRPKAGTWAFEGQGATSKATRSDGPSSRSIGLVARLIVPKVGTASSDEPQLTRQAATRITDRSDGSVGS